MKVSLELIKQWEKEYTGNYSIIYPKIADRLTGYDEYDIAFAGEFLFFEVEYFKIIRHIFENNIKKDTIIDIGCQFGFQSELFIDNGYRYIGIDRFKHNFFNRDKENVNYLIGTFPTIELPLNNSITISCMSLGYFNNYIGEDEDIVLDKLTKELAICSHLYIKTTPELINKLKSNFLTGELIFEREILNKKFILYYFSNEC